MAYGLKYTLQNYRDHHGRLTKINILERDYIGGSSQIKCGASPLSFNFGNSGNDKMKVIQGSSCTITLKSEIQDQFTEFFTPDDRKYKVEIYKDGAIYWTGWITPEIFTQPYAPAPYFINITAVDGLGDLKNISFNSDGTPYTGRKKLAELLGICLHKTDLGLSFNEISGFRPDGFAAGSLLDKLYYSADALSDDDGNPLKCYDVLETLFQGYNICQRDGKWWITRVTKKHSGGSVYNYSYDGATLTVNGEDLTASHPILTLNNSRAAGEKKIVLSDGAELETMPGTKQRTAIHTYGLKESILTNYNFAKGVEQAGDDIITGWTLEKTGDTRDMELVWRKDSEGNRYAHIYHSYIEGDGLAQLKQTVDNIEATSTNIEISGRVAPIELPGFTTDPPTTTDKIIFQVILTGSSQTYYLDKDNGWVTNETNIRLDGVKASADPSKPTWTDFSIRTNGFPEPGSLTVCLWAMSATTMTVFRRIGIGWSDIIISQTGEEEAKEVLAVNNNLYNHIPDDLELFVGDCPDITNYKLLYDGYFSDSAANRLTTWHDDSSGIGYDYAEFLLREFILQNQKPHKKLRGKVRGHLAPGSTLIDVKGDKFVLTYAAVNDKDGTWDIEAIEVFDYSAQTLAVTINPTTAQSSSGSRSTGSTGGSSGGGSLITDYARLFSENLFTAKNAFAGGISVDSIEPYTEGGTIQITGSIQVSGDIIQNGDSYITHAEQINIENNLGYINSGEVGAGVTAGFAGWQVDRGSLVDYRFGFDEASDSFRLGELGNLQAVATREDSPLSNGVAVWDAVNFRFKTLAKAPDSDKLGGFEASKYMRSDVDDETATGVKTWFRGAITGQGGSAATVQVNGFQRTGPILIHQTSDGGTTSPLASGYKELKNIGDVLKWDGHTIWNASNANLATVDWNVKNLLAAGNVAINRGQSIKLKGNNDTTHEIYNDTDDFDTVEVSAGFKVKHYSNGSYFSVDSSGNSKFEKNLESNATFIGGFAGSNWRLEKSTNHLTLDNLTVRKAMKIYELVINRIRATNGSLWVNNAMRAESVDTDAPYGYYTIYLDDDEGSNLTVPFTVGAIVMARKFTGRDVRYVVLEVDSIDPDGKSFGALYLDGEEPLDGDEFVQIGHATDTDQQGSLYLSASDNGSPYMDVIDGVSNEDWTGHTRLRVGKLSGISGQYGYGIWGSKDGTNEAFVISSGDSTHSAYARIAGWNFDSGSIWKDYQGAGYDVWMGYDSKLGSSGTSVRGFGVTKDSSNRIFMGQSASHGFELAAFTAGVNSFRLSSVADQTHIAGWKFNNEKIYKGNSTDGYLAIHSGSTAVMAHKGTVWGYFGQTFDPITMTQTGEYGISFGDEGTTKKEYFRIDTGVRRIAGWNFDENRIYKDDGSGGQVSLDKRYTTIAVHKGTVFGYFGQTWDVNQNSYTGHYGISFGDEGATKKEYFRIDTGVRRIAGWNFDEGYLWSGTKQTSNAYTTDGVTIASAGAIRAKEFRIDTDGKAFFKGEITASKGNIGGFNIGSNSLSGGDEGDDRFVLFPQNYIAFLSGNGAQWAGIGNNVFPASSGQIAVARFENNESNAYSTNYALYAKATGGQTNIAGYFEGDLEVQGGIIHKYYNLDSSYESVVKQLPNGANYAFYRSDSANNKKLILPRIDSVKDGALIRVYCGGNGGNIDVWKHSSAPIHGNITYERYTYFDDPGDGCWFIAVRDGSYSGDGSWELVEWGR